jgi:hypothetical protein
MRALGLLCLEAPGEAEALAAALNAAGAVDAVLSSDGDALTFGARTLYRQLHLSRAALKTCVVERCAAAAAGGSGALRAGGSPGAALRRRSVDAAAVRDFFGLARGGTELLTALSLFAVRFLRAARRRIAGLRMF